MNRRPTAGTIHDRTPRGSRRAAFTLVELLITIVILGIAATLVVPQLASSAGFEVQAAARTVMADLQFAQNDAIAHQAPRRVVFDLNAQRYRVTDADGIALPSPTHGGTYEVRFGGASRFPDTQIAAVDFNGNPEVRFDALGTPSDGGTIELIAEGTRYRLTVVPLTGRVEVERVNGGA